jgi:hypothetical protein
LGRQGLAKFVDRCPGLSRERCRTVCGLLLAVAPDAHVDLIIDVRGQPARSRVVLEQRDGLLVGWILRQNSGHLEDLPGEVTRKTADSELRGSWFRETRGGPAPPDGNSRNALGTFHDAATAGSSSSSTVDVAASRYARLIIPRPSGQK